MKFWVDNMYFLDYAFGEHEDYRPTWSKVDLRFGLINLKEHKLMAAIDLHSCIIYIFDSMSNYICEDIVSDSLQLVARSIPSILIVIGFDKSH